MAVGTYPNPTLFATATGTPTPRKLADRFDDIINGLDYGIVADGATDNTTALQNAINALQSATYEGVAGRLMLPIGRILTQPLTISGQITLEGVSGTGTVLVLKTGATAPLITVQTAGSAFPAGAPMGEIYLRTLRLENATGKTGSAAAHGLALVAGAWPARVILEDVTIYGMSGDGLNAYLFGGFFDAYNTFITNNAGNGISANSCTDCHLYGGLVGVNSAAGALLSGCTNFVFTGTNVYSNATFNLSLFGTAGAVTGQHQFIGCMFDRGNQVGVGYGMAETNGAAFIGCTFGGCSTVTPGTYSAVLIQSGANSKATFIGCFWPETNGHTSGTSDLYALQFGDAVATAIVDPTNNFQGAGLLRTNAPAQVFVAAMAAAIISIPLGMTLFAANPLFALHDTTQPTGFRRFGIENTSQQLQIFTADDTGAPLLYCLQLLRTGVVLAPNGMQIAKFGANGNTPSAKVTVTGAKGGNAALTSLIAALVTFGLITDTTT